MIALAYYLLKVMICSGLLFLYYHFALRNKIYHQWNRFYLLAVVALSLVIPCFEFTIWQTAGKDESNNLQLLYLIYNADEYVANAETKSFFNRWIDYWPIITYITICGGLLASFLLSLNKIRSIISRHSVSKIDDIKFVNTEVKNSPFSFFSYIFWNKQIDISSSTGQLIFQHELVHVREKHTLDKICMQLVLVVFWSNPFFWLISKELKMLHEFIADEKAIGQKDATAFAAMIIQAAHPKQFMNLTNQFFQSPIKRRLTMLTKNQKTRISYASRILALPVTTFLVLAFTIKTKSTNDSSTKTPPTLVTAEIKKDTISNPLVFIDGVEKGRLKDLGGADKLMKPEKIKAMFVFKGKEAIDKFGQKGKDGVIEIVSVDAPPPPPPPAPKNSERSATDVFQSSPTSINDDYKINKEVFFIIDGKERGLTSMSEIEKELKPEEIASLEVMKDKAAIEKYGAKGKNGVIIITTKSFSPLIERQTGSEKPNNVIFEKVEEEARFPGGEKGWRDFLQKNLNATTPIHKGAKAGQYTVEILFVVNENGELSNFQTLTKHGYGMEEEVERLMKNSPNWIPAQQNGKIVTSYRKQPITFVIQEQ